MATTLQELRKEAGYRTAKDFAEALDVPATTYARYEQTPEKIPLRAAWNIADALGCSIDAVVGREHVDVDAMRGEVQKFYDSVSDDNKQLLDEFFSFIRGKERDAKYRKRLQEEHRYEEIALDYNKRLFESAGSDEELFNRAVFGNAQKERADFILFVEDEMAEARIEEIEAECDKLADDIRQLSILDEDDDKNIYGLSISDPEFEEKLEELVDRKREQLEADYEERDDKEVKLISEAYDRMRRRRNMGRGRMEYYHEELPLS